MSHGPDLGAGPGRTSFRPGNETSMDVETSGLAHDLRNLLTVITASLPAAMASVEADPDALERLEEAQRAAVRATELADQLLEGGRRSTVPVECLDLGALLRGQRSLLGALVRPRRTTLRLEHPAGRVWAEVDRTGLQRVLANLVLNASQAGAANVTVSVEPDSGPSGPVLVVTDDGPGMSQVVQDRLFDPGFSTRGQGSGIGLYSARELVRAMGGRLQVASTPGEGSCFRIRLRAASDLR